ncbi:MAG: stage III sporulation protein AB [Evtepia sp.]
MIHWIGKWILLFCFAAIGVGEAGRLQKRTRCLNEFRMALGTMERELSFSLLPVGALLAKMQAGVSGRVKTFLVNCAENFRLCEEERCGEIWNRTLMESDLPLREDDLLLVGEVGNILGKYDGESQGAALVRIQDKLEELSLAAKEETERMGRVYITVGIVAGLFCMILL